MKRKEADRSKSLLEPRKEAEGTEDRENSEKQMALYSRSSRLSESVTFDNTFIIPHIVRDCFIETFRFRTPLA